MALLGALQLDLFSTMSDGPMGSDEIAATAGTDPPSTKRLLDVLVASELVMRNGDEFSLSQEADVYLVSDSPWSRTASAEMLKLFWGSCLDTASVVRGDRQIALAARCHDGEQFLRALHTDACTIADLATTLIEIPETGVLLDVGGGSGGAALTFSQHRPNLRCCVVELPEIASTSQRLLAEFDKARAVSVSDHDIVAAPVPGEADVVWAQFLTQTMGGDDARRAVTNMVRSLRSGGQVHLVDIVTGEAGASDQAALFDLVLLNLYPRGQVYPVAGVKQWLHDAGAVDVTSRRISDMVAITSATAPERSLL